MDRSAIAVVTGASRGAGAGIAVALGSHGCTVYVTGRSQEALAATAHHVTAAGGNGIAVVTDHADDADVAALFARVREEQGHLDILVNNACALHDAMTAPGHFWEKPVEIGDMIDVGIRSSFVASWHAAPLMIDRPGGLVAFTSAAGAMHYVFGPAYGAHKAGIDKMAHDMAIDLRDAGIAAVSVWMGSLATERLLAMIAAEPHKYGRLADSLEAPGYTGHVLWALFNDPERMALSGKTVIGAELGRQYGIVDSNGRFPPSVRDSHGVAPPTYHPHIIR